MSEAPERIWAWWDDEYDTGLINTHGDKRYTPEDAREYVRADRIKELETENKRLNSMIASVIDDTGDDPEIMAASRAEWAARAFEAGAKLAKALAALDEAIYLLDPDDEDIAKGAGLYRIVKTYEELKGEM
jgi:hypothetical protein